MKTKVKALYNYLEIPFEPVTEIITEAELSEEIQNEIQNELLTRKMYSSPDFAEIGDIAELKLESDQPRYHKNKISLNLGLGLFSKALESTVIGKKAGESYTAEVDGCIVKITVRSVKRRVKPELNDLFIQTLDIDGVTTVDGYKAHLTKKYLRFFKEAYTEYHAMDLFDEMLEKSDIDYCKADIQPFLSQFDDGEADSEAAEEDAWFVLNLYLADCIARGIDYRKNEDLPLGTKCVNALRDRVLAPIIHYLDDKVTLKIVKEETNGCI